MLLFLRNLASICRTLWKQCCNEPGIESPQLCNTCALVQYLNRKIPIEIQVNFWRVKVISTHKQNIFVRAIAMKVLSIFASYFIFETWTAKSSRILLFDAKGQRSANLWRPGCTSVLKENLNISASQILPFLYQDGGWCKEGVENVKEQKGHLSRSIGMFSQRSLFFLHFLCQD